MRSACDLHTHSRFSDGTLTPAQLVDRAVNIGLRAIALTDHNTVDGLPDFLSAAEGKPIEAIPGAEFSVDLDGKELHLLGLFISETHFPTIADKMRDVIRRKEMRYIELLDALREAGYPMDYEVIKQRCANGKINRMHIAAEMAEKGYAPSIDFAFKQILSPKAGYYKEPERLSVWEILDFLRSIHAVPVLAHPFLNLSADELASFLPRAKECGLMGMETAYSTYDTATSELAAAMASEFSLLPSGGSDFHGSNKPDIQLGTGKCNLFIPYEWVKNLKECVL